MSVGALDALVAIEAFINVRLAKAETAPSRKDRDAKQARYLNGYIADLRRYFVEFAERIGIEIDTTLPPETKPKMVNPEHDVRNNKVTKRKTFVGLPTRAPFDLPIDWRKEADELGKVLSQHHEQWLGFGNNISMNDLQQVGVDLDDVRGLTGSLQLGDYDKSIRSSLANRVVRVSEVQRTVVRDTVQRGIDAGLSTKEIANGARINGKVYPGIKGRVEQMYRNRSRVIALTESANAYNLGQLEGYKRSGVVTKVRIFDGADCGWTSHDDGDKANGTVRTLESAQAYPTSHPNCQRSWAPVPLAQTQGVGGTRSRTGSPRTQNPSPTPKTNVPRLPRQPSTANPADKVGRPGTTWHEASFEEAINHFAPDGYRFSQLDDATWGLVDDTGRFRQGITIDKAAQQRARDIMRERYGVTEVNFDFVTKSTFAYEDVQGVMLAFEDYRKLGVGFDDLIVSFTKKSGDGALAHFQTAAGSSGEVQFHQSLVRSARRPARISDGNYTGFRSTAQHELGHALDDRVIGGAAGRGGVWNPGWVRSTANREFLEEWRLLHRGSKIVGNTDDAAARLANARSKLDDIERLIAEAERKARTGDYIDDIDRQVSQRSLKAYKTTRTSWRKLVKELDEAVKNPGQEPYPTNYARTGGSVEDFADTARSYLQNPERFRAKFPQRAKYFEEALERGRALPKNYADDVPLPPRNAAYKDYKAARNVRTNAKRTARRTGGRLYEKPPKPPPSAADTASRSSTYRALTPDAEFLTPGRVVNIHEPYYKAVQKGIPRTDKPTVRMTGGGPASGKSKAILENPEAGIPSKLKSSHIDPDAAKKAIPEYKQMVNAKDEAAAGIMHEESSHMAKAAVKRALGKDPKTGKVNGTDVVYDSVGDSGIDKLSAKVAKFREQGAARVESDYVTVDVDEAIRRAVDRAKNTGRHVDEGVVRSSHADITDTVFGAIDRGTFDKLTLWGNDVPKGHPPIKIAVYTKGAPQPLKILRPDLFDDFAAQGSYKLQTAGVADDAARVAQEAVRTKRLAATLGDADEAARIVQSQGPKAKAAKVRDLDDLVAGPKQEGESLLDYVKRTKAAKEERAEWARNWQGDIAETLPDDQLAALKAYTEGGYSKTNSGLRGTRPEFIEEARASRDTIRAAMTPLDEPVQVYRGVKPSALGLDDIDDILSLKPGVEVSDPGFLSTSLSKSTAQSFSRGSGNINLQMRVPAGTRATYVESISSSVGETELILDAGQTLKIVSVTRKVEGGFDVVVDIV